MKVHKLHIQVIFSSLQATPYTKQAKNLPQNHLKLKKLSNFNAGTGISRG